MRIWGIAAAALLAVSAIAAGAYERVSNGGITEHPAVAGFLEGFSSSESSSTEEDLDWRLTDVDELLADFDDHPHRAERDYRNVRIEGRVRAIDGATSKQPHLILMGEHASGLRAAVRYAHKGLVVDVSRAQAADANVGDYVLIHCREVVAEYARDTGGGFTEGYLGNYPWCKSVQKVGLGLDAAPPYSPPTAPPASEEVG